MWDDRRKRRGPGQPGFPSRDRRGRYFPSARSCLSRQAEFDISFNEGVSVAGELIDLGVEYGLLEKSGSWYSWGSEKIGQGKESVKAHLKSHPELLKTLDTAIREKAGVPSRPAPASSEPAGVAPAKSNKRGGE